MKKHKTTSNQAKGAASPSHLMDARIASLTDWRGETRALIRQADAQVVAPTACLRLSRRIDI